MRRCCRSTRCCSDCSRCWGTARSRRAFGLRRATASSVVPLLFARFFPGWFAGVADAAVAIGALVPAAIMCIGAANLFASNVFRRILGRSRAGENRVRANPYPGDVRGSPALHPVRPGSVCNRLSAARRCPDAANFSGLRPGTMDALVQPASAVGGVGGGNRNAVVRWPTRAVSRQTSPRARSAAR